MIIVIGLFNKRSCDPFPLAVKHILYDFVHINGHAKCQADSLIIEGFSLHVVADIGITKGKAGKALVLRVVS